VKAGFGSIALSLAGLTLAARIVGFGRSLVFSKTVGDTCLGDAYNAANSLPNVLFEIVAGGVLAGVVIPVVARHVGGGRQREASQTVSALITWTLLALTPAALAAFAGAALYGRTFATQCAGSASTIAALLIMFVPQIWFYGLAVVSAGVLQAHQRFLAAAFAPLLSSVVVITAYLIFAGTSGRTALWVLGLGTTLGVVALALTTAVPLYRLGLRLRPRLRFAAGDRAVVTRIAAAGIVGLVLQQISVLLINYSAQRSLDPGALTRYTWANAIYLLPYAVLAAPLLQLAFPRLAAAADSDAGAVRRVLAEFLPVLTISAWLGAALLVATAVPVARVFVLGPGSGRTAALAWPIALFGPAVVGFALLGLASRTLLAQHRARDAGLVTIAGWGAVIVGVLLFGRTVPLLAVAMSAGLGVGAVVGWILVRRSAAITLGGPLGRPMLAGLLAAVVASGAALWPALQLFDVGLLAATAGAIGLALFCTMIFVGVLRLVQPRLVAELWARRPRPAGWAS
jgi:putative peptidoglycan lipid II flippase